ncbi:L1 protein [Alphapapillomavirus 5]|uniref:Major capsid protein L1 n=1 Tax=Human papillomavirus type 26 TaxID=333762 RepID=A0A219KW94_HPV26|nr:late protein L1 [Human papillomavirus type 26]AHY96060.1 late protein L1 [Human papillomavirus type 26]WBM84032.1 L1 protein [Alphapapillomavirus 5]
MALWRTSDSKVYLPPTPVSRVVNTDEYVTRTGIYYYAGSSRLLTLGHPYFSIPKTGQKAEIPKVSAYQYRVFRVHLPDPNKFGLPDPQLYNPDTERLVWACVGVEVGRGQPLGIGLSGNPLFNKLDDTENSHLATVNADTDNRDNVSVDNKQTQLCIIGCTPPLGEHWGVGTICKNTQTQRGDCPPLELISSIIEDGDMIDTGFGAMDFTALQATKSDVPIDISQSTCKYPDYLKMSADTYGNSMFFFLRREQLFARHFYNKAGAVGDAIPTTLYIKGAESGREPPTSSIYSATPSGSMVTSDAQLFNKPYWLQRAQGHNNGICWGNQLFVTCVDTTRSTNLTISTLSAASASTPFKPSDYKQFIRHGEEYELQFIFQLCKITLTTDVMAYIHLMNASILEDWNFGLTLPPTASLEDAYRFIKNSATTCQRNAPPVPKEDPFQKFKFWDVDLKEKFSIDLDQFPLGRKFMLQAGIQRRPKLGTKRPLSSTSSSTKRKKRKLTK